MEAAPPPPPEPEPEPEKPPTQAETPKSRDSGSSRASRGSRKVKRTGSSVFSMFTQKQVAEFKEVHNIFILLICQNNKNYFILQTHLLS